MTVPNKGKNKLVERICYTFKEDDSMVSAEICEVKE